MVYSKGNCEPDVQKNHRAVFAIILIGFLIRVIIPILAFYVTKDIKIFHSYDTSKYIGAGLGLVTSGQFTTNGIPETVRTPGYPILMVPGLWFGAVEPFTVALQILLSCFTIYLIYKIGFVLFESPEPSLLAAGLYAVEPLSVIYTNLLMSETLFATTLMCFVYYFLKYLKNDDWKHLIISAVLSAVCVYVRPLSYFLAVFITLFLLVRTLIKRTWTRKTVSQVLSFLFISYALLAPWQFRNAHYTNNWSFSGVSSDDLYFFTASTVLAQINKVPYEDQRQQMAYISAELYLKPHPGGGEWTENEVRRWRSSEAFKIITSYPLAYLKMVSLGVTWTVGGPGVGSWLELFKINQDVSGKGRFATEDDKLYYLRVSRLSYWGSLFLGLTLAMYWTMAVLGAYKMHRRETWPLIFLIFVGVYFVLVPAMLAIGYSRFRHPVLPIVSILGGYGLFTIFSWLRKRRRVSVK
jgi:4-amino-4-deoxy-L-arabinose transferase-like glycosyltransferase